jgi:hypothetical protein
VLISTKKPAFGGYGGPTIAYTHMLHRDGALIGLEGAFLIDHRLSLGLAGYGFTRTPDGPPTALGTPREFATGYGGFQIRYAAFLPDVPVYASIGMLFGGGTVVLAVDHDWDEDWEEGDADDISEVSDGYFVIQPDITLHTNITRWLRFGITGGYRFAGPVDDGDFDGDALRGVVVGGNIQAGWL